MATVIEQRTPPAAIEIMGEKRIGIDGVSYEFYKRFCEEIGEQPIRLSYCDGCLEIMVTKSSHEFFKKVLAKLIEATIFELDMPVRSGGAMTFQRDDLEKGFEPDECWWIANEKKVRRITDFDFLNDPPPDLAIEIEISHSLTNRIHIFEAMKIPEVWRYDGKQLRFCLLNKSGRYKDSPASRSFPFLKPKHLQPFLALPNAEDETTRIRNYVNWLRKNKPKA